MQQFGDRLYENLVGRTRTRRRSGDLSDYLPATLDVLTAQGGLRALPQHSEQEIYIYNKEYFQDAGPRSREPADRPGTSCTRRPRSSPTATGSRARCRGSSASAAAPTGSASTTRSRTRSSCRDDRTQVLFNNDQGLLAFETLDKGFTAKFFDPNLDPTVDDYATGKLFNGGKTASQINFAELWGQAVSGNEKDFGATISADVVGATIMPGIQPGTSGSINGFEGYGINKFSKNKEAALHYLMYEEGVQYQKAAQPHARRCRRAGSRS